MRTGCRHRSIDRGRDRGHTRGSITNAEAIVRVDAGRLRSPMEGKGIRKGVRTSAAEEIKGRGNEVAGRRNACGRSTTVRSVEEWREGEGERMVKQRIKFRRS